MVLYGGEGRSGECESKASYRIATVHVTTREEGCGLCLATEEGDEIVHWSDGDAAGMVCACVEEGCA